MRNLTEYEVVSVLGSGSSGTCFKVRHKGTGEIFAWKAIDYDAWMHSLEEFELLLQLKHSNIVDHLDYILNKETKTVYIVMEYCAGGDLSQLIERCKLRNVLLLEDFIWRVLYQICRALQFCHAQVCTGSFLHRDIKPANVFLDSVGHVKVGDFGLAKVLSSKQQFADSFVGTPYYMSPEIIKGGKYSRKLDVWSLGCLVYEMCALRPPFSGQQLEQLSRNISRGSFNRIPDCYSSDLQDIVSFMLDVRNDSRPSVDVILHHPTLAARMPSGDVAFPPFVNLPQSKAKYSPIPYLSSTHIQDERSSLSTPALRSQLFGSVHRRLFTASNPDLTCNDADNKCDPVWKVTEPSVVTQNVFNEALAARLHAIRVRESALKQREAELKTWEKQLNERSDRIATKEKSLEALLKRKCSVRRSKKPTVIKRYDDIDSSLAPNDSIIPATIAKLDLANMKRPKAMQRVTFQSPKKFVQYSIENGPRHSTAPHNLKSSTSSKASDDSDKLRRLKSVLSFFGSQKSEKLHGNREGHSVENLEPAAIASKWTDESKKAAFKILAEMNDPDKRSMKRASYRRSFIVPKSETTNILL